MMGETQLQTTRARERNQMSCGVHGGVQTKLKGKRVLFDIRHCPLYGRNCFFNFVLFPTCWGCQGRVDQTKLKNRVTHYDENHK
jgi:hypothetical protein